jgi:hypothetical protein
MTSRPAAPILYMLFVKLMSILFGNSEAAVRSFSFAALIGVVVLQSVLLRRAFKLEWVFVLFAAAVTSSFSFYMRYSGEMKPYMGDAFFAFAVLFVYWLVTKGRLQLWLATLIYALFLFFSTASAFFIAAVYVIEFLRAAFRKDRRMIITVLACGLFIALVFTFNYILFQKPFAELGTLMHFWYSQKFELRPLNLDTLARDLALFDSLFIPFGVFKYVYMIFSLAGIIVSLCKRNLYSVWFVLSVGLMLVASSLDKYPVIDRLWLFFYGFAILYSFVFIAWIWECGILARRAVGNSGELSVGLASLIPLLLSASLFLPNANFPVYATLDESVLIPGNQANPLIAYLKENVHEGETVYSYKRANQMLGFKNGYGNSKIGDVSRNNIIHGNEHPLEDIDEVLAGKHAYLLMCHAYFPLTYDIDTGPFLNTLREYGYVDKLMEVYETPLYWFTTDRAELRTKAELYHAGWEEENGERMILIEIVNTGETILENTEQDAVKPVLIKYRNGKLVEETVLGEMESKVLPNESRIFSFPFEAPADCDSYEIDLRSGERFLFSELGMDTIVPDGY